MSDENLEHFPDFTKSVIIDAPVAEVWKTITVPVLMQKWLFDDKVKVTVDWQVGGIITIEVLEHWVLSTASGKVLKIKPEKLLQYTQLSSLSRLPDEPKNHCVLEFDLTPIEKDKTQLNFTASNFPTESIHKHMVFYWFTTVDIIKESVEKSIK